MGHSIVPMMIKYEYMTLTQETCLPAQHPTRAKHKPNVQIGGSYDKLYTLMMFHPNGHGSNWIHWMVANIPGGSNLNEAGWTVFSYEGPKEEDGVNGVDCRYSFTLYEQTRDLLLETPTSRVDPIGFLDPCGFASQQGLNPVNIMTLIVRP